MDPLWNDFKFEGEGIRCTGFSPRQQGERFKVSANGGTFEVIVISITQRGSEITWEAIDVARAEAQVTVNEEERY